MYDNGAKVTHFAGNNYCFVCNTASISCFPEIAVVETEEETSFSLTIFWVESLEKFGVVRNYLSPIPI